MSDYVEKLMTEVTAKNPGEVEFHQAVEEIAASVDLIYQQYPEYRSAKIFERMIEPERVIMFRVPWLDDQGEIHINRGYRVEMNSAIGPYKGGLRFHPSVNLSSLKFLALEQTFKNSLTSLPLGAGKGGSDFNPKGKSDLEIMRFCQSFMNELFRYIGSCTDVPAGDIGVGGREIGYLFGQYKKLKNEFTGVLTGKGIEWGGSLIRPEATGFGVVYFIEEMLKTRGEVLKGKRVAISGFGNVAWGVAMKLDELGAKVITLSGPDGYVYDEAGVSGEKIASMVRLRATNNDVVAPYADLYPGVEFYQGKRPWEVPCDIAIPCAIQNEFHDQDAEALVKNQCMCVCEGANMPCTLDAIQIIQHSGVLCGPGKAANAGGVAVSGLEMSQNAMKMMWSREEVNRRLREIMQKIHETCYKYGQKSCGYVDYIHGANMGGFLKVANAMLDQGVV
ncbi:NADP-specific glutamate dehydrogenase [bacterium]|nr:NADP-specific glutamate dehydrogenase [bacterium]